MCPTLSSSLLGPSMQPANNVLALPRHSLAETHFNINSHRETFDSDNANAKENNQQQQQHQKKIIMLRRASESPSPSCPKDPLTQAGPSSSSRANQTSATGSIVLVWVVVEIIFLDMSLHVPHPCYVHTNVLSWSPSHLPPPTLNLCFVCFTTLMFLTFYLKSHTLHTHIFNFTRLMSFFKKNNKLINSTLPSW